METNRLTRKMHSRGRWDYDKGNYSGAKGNYEMISKTSDGNLRIENGEIYLKQTSQLQRELCDYIEEYAGEKLEIDFSRVKKMDLSVVAAFVVAKSRANDKGIKLSFNNLGESCDHAFRGTYLENLFGLSHIA